MRSLASGSPHDSVFALLRAAAVDKTLWSTDWTTVPMPGKSASIDKSAPVSSAADDASKTKKRARWSDEKAPESITSASQSKSSTTGGSFAGGSGGGSFSVMSNSSTGMHGFGDANSNNASHRGGNALGLGGARPAVAASGIGLGDDGIIYLSGGALAAVKGGAGKRSSSSSGVGAPSSSSGGGSSSSSFATASSSNAMPLGKKGGASGVGKVVAGAGLSTGVNASSSYAKKKPKAMTGASAAELEKLKKRKERLGGASEASPDAMQLVFGQQVGVNSVCSVRLLTVIGACLGSRWVCRQIRY